MQVLALIGLVVLLVFTVFWIPYQLGAGMPRLGPEAIEAFFIGLTTALVSALAVVGAARR